MSNTLKTICAVCGSVLLLSACGPQNDVANMKPGKYESTTRSTDKHGTSYEKDNTTEVTVDRYGNKKAVVETETTTDPKGLFNKRTNTSRKVYQSPSY